MAQDYLLACGVSFRNITIYHMFKAPRYTALRSVPTQGGFTSDIERDKAMTEHSDYDIAFIRKGKESSGTAQKYSKKMDEVKKPTEKERFESLRLHFTSLFLQHPKMLEVMSYKDIVLKAKEFTKEYLKHE